MRPPELPHPRDLASLAPLLHQHAVGRYKLAGYLAEGQVRLDGCWVDDAAAPRGVIMQHRDRYNVVAVDDAALQRMLAAIDWSSEVRFSSFPQEYLPVLEDSAQIVFQNPAYLYHLEADTFRPQIDHPVRRLNEDDAPLVVEGWDYGDDIDYCLERIRNAASAGTEIDGQLASFIITHSDGAMGVLHTRRELRRQGLGRSVTSALARALLNQGRKTYCFIVEGNDLSMRLFESLGFRRLLACSWVLAAKP